MWKKYAYKEFKKLILRLIKQAFSLPYKGSPEPVLELFFRFNPDNIIVRNFLQNQAKWSDIFILEPESLNE